MKKFLKVVGIIIIILALLAGGIFAIKLYRDWKSAQNLKKQRELTRDVLSEFEYTVPEGFHNKATGESNDYEWWVCEEGTMVADIRFFAWAKNESDTAEESIELLKSHANEGMTVRIPEEDVDIDGIHGKKITLESKTGFEDWFGTRETYCFLETEKGLLRIEYSITDDDKFAGRDRDTNRCVTCEKEFFDSLKKK